MFSDIHVAQYSSIPCLAIDVSMSSDLNVIKSYLIHIHDSLCHMDTVDLKVIFFTHVINDVVDINKHNIDLLLDYCLDNFNGGTVVENVFDYLKSQKCVPSLLTIFTDGFIFDYGDPDYCPTKFLIHGDNISAVKHIPYGTIEYFNLEIMR